MAGPVWKYYAARSHSPADLCQPRPYLRTRVSKCLQINGQVNFVSQHENVRYSAEFVGEERGVRICVPSKWNGLTTVDKKQKLPTIERLTSVVKW